MDQTIEQQLKELLDRYLSGEVSLAEMETLRLMIAASSDEQLAGCLEENWEDFQSDLILQEDRSHRMLRDILNEGKATPVIELTQHRSTKSRWKWWLAAASVLLLFAISIPLLRKHDPAEDMAGNHGLTNDVLPGHNGAILTLADGQTVLLDSLADGLITSQGNSNVSINDGHLEYAVQNASTAVLYNTMTTPKGRQFELVLPDGSMVWLNAASSITYPTSFNGSERRVSITGEAYFEVAKDPKRPFRVNVNNTSEVEVLGTHFDINSYADDGNIKTTLLEGSVKVTSASLKPVLLAPGQQAVCAADKSSQQPIRLMDDPDIEQVLAWKNGLFNFNHTNLYVLLKQLARWYDINIRFEGDVRNRNFNGEITRDLKLSQVLDVLKRVGIGFRIEGQTLVVTN